MANVLVTGANGFLGRYLVAQLAARGDRVRALVRREFTFPDAETVRADIRDEDAVTAACRDMDVVYHAAAVAGVWGSWRHYYGINTLGTQHVIAGCRRHAVSKLVFTSSPSVTFDGQAQENVDESAPYPTRWLCHYPHTKALAEQLVLQASDRNLATCALRPHLIWGPGDQHLIPRLLERARRGRLRRVGDGSNRIDITYVENAAAAHLQAADALAPDSPVAGRAYFISQGEPVLCWDWIDEVLALAGLPPVRRAISLQTARRIGAVLEGVHRLARFPGEPRMTRFLALQLGTSHYFNIGRAQRDFSYSPQIAASDGMQRLAEYLACGA